MKSLGLWIAAATLAMAGGAHADVCSQRDITRTATLVLDMNRSLAAIQISEDKQTEVSPAARKGIAAMKDRLNDYTVAVMHCAPEKITTPALHKTLLGFAGVNPAVPGPPQEPSPDAARYGGNLLFDVSAQSSAMIGIAAHFGIACGEDVMLMIFERRSNAWVETLRTQSTPYKTVAGGWWAFDYGVSSDKDGHWFVVTKNVAPWCSSTWSEIRYAVLRPGADAAHPRTLLSKSDSIWWGTDRAGELKVKGSGFDLRWRAESMDGDVHNREWIARYDIDGDRVVRGAPIAESPRDFADEWVRLPWKDAEDWTVVAHRSKAMHDQLQKQHYFSYISVRRCSDGDHTQIEVEPVEGDQRHVFFQVFGTKVLQMGDVGFKPEAVCNGPNLFDMNMGK